jgi:hypothetical protein
VKEGCCWVEVFVLLLAGSSRAAADEFAELEDDGIGDGVEDGVAFTAASDEAGVEEDLEVFGDVGLVGIEGVDELGDGVFAGFQGLEDAESEGFAEGAEAAGDVVDHLVAKWN